MMTLIPAKLPPTVLRVAEEQNGGEIIVYYNIDVKMDTLTDATLIINTPPEVNRQ